MFRTNPFTNDCISIICRYFFVIDAADFIYCNQGMFTINSIHDDASVANSNFNIHVATQAPCAQVTWRDVHLKKFRSTKFMFARSLFSHIRTTLATFLRQEKEKKLALVLAWEKLDQGKRVRALFFFINIRGPYLLHR